MKQPKAEGINHLNIRVRNLERSSSFYKRIFGMKEAFREPPQAIFLKCGEDLLTLARTTRPPRRGGIRFGFQARNKEDFHLWKRWLLKNRIRMTSEREEESCGGMYFRDPDGYLIEIYYEKE